MRRICPYGSGTIGWVPQGTGLIRERLAQRVFDQTNVPLPGVGMNPGPPDDLVVNMATWLWVESFGPVGVSASAGPVTVTVTASPVAVRWSMGNGDVVVCNRPHSLRHVPTLRGAADWLFGTYRRSSASAPCTFVVQTSATWDVTWTASGSPPAAPSGP